jgi:putative hydrolase of the HAD superfamily
MFELIAFDADDTLWQNEELYRMGRARFEKILAGYELRGTIDDHVDDIEIGNLKYYGYGVMGFVMSLIEASIRLTDGQISGEDLLALIALAKEMISAEVSLLDGAEQTVATLNETYPLMLVTKGDLLHQRSKIDRSGLAGYFQQVEIVSDKTPDVYANILRKHGIDPSRFVMVGNSLRSDILPVVELGGWAVHIPNHLTWSYEAVPPPSADGHRYYEVESLGQVPALIEKLAITLTNSEI